MRRTILRPLAGLVFVVATAQGVAAQQVVSDQGTTAVVRGRITDVDGWPVPLAEVTIGGRTVRSDLAGRFVIDGVPRGTVDVNARRVGYAPFKDRMQVAAGTIDSLELIVNQLPGRQLEAVRVIGSNQRELARNRVLARGGRSWNAQQLATGGDLTVTEFVSRETGLPVAVSWASIRLGAATLLNAAYDQGGARSEIWGQVDNRWRDPGDFTPVGWYTVGQRGPVAGDMTPWGVVGDSWKDSGPMVRPTCRSMTCEASRSLSCDRVVTVDGVRRDALAADIVIARGLDQVDMLDDNGCVSFALWTKPPTPSAGGQ